MTATDDRNGQEPPCSSILVLPIVLKKFPYSVRNPNFDAEYP